MTDDLVKRLTIKAGVMEMGEKIAWGSDTSLMREAAKRIEELLAENKLLSEGVTIAHLRGAMDAHANRADDLWAEFKDRWEGEKKFALREVVKYLRGGKDE
jgi:hypothetical protein